MAGHVMQNMGTEGAMEWVLGHMEDANFNEPMSQPSETAAPSQTSAAGSASAGPAADPETVMMLVSMGFTDAQAAAALKVSMLCCLLKRALCFSCALPFCTSAHICPLCLSLIINDTVFMHVACISQTTINLQYALCKLHMCECLCRQGSSSNMQITAFHS